MTSRDRANLIIEVLRHELRKVDAKDLATLHFSIVAQINEAERVQMSELNRKSPVREPKSVSVFSLSQQGLLKVSKKNPH